VIVADGATQIAAELVMVQGFATRSGPGQFYGDFQDRRMDKSDDSAAPRAKRWRNLPLYIHRRRQRYAFLRSPLGSAQSSHLDARVPGVQPVLTTRFNTSFSVKTPTGTSLSVMTIRPTSGDHLLDDVKPTPLRPQPLSWSS
jgi:hypothetical protein